MGDDLIFARSFVSDSTAALHRLISDGGRACSMEMEQTMTHIQSGAKSLHARSIYQSAQAVLHSLTNGSINASQTDGRLISLNGLLNQYSSGLEEIAPETPVEHIVEAETIPKVIAPITEAPSSEFKTAKTVLQDMLPYASKQETENLTRLMTVRDRSESSAPKIPLDSIMREIVQDALAIARICAKTISLSYDVGETSLAEIDLGPLKLRVSRTLRALVLETLPTDKLGHIDMTSNEMTFIIKAQGSAPRFGSHEALIRHVGETCEISLPLVSDKLDAAPDLITPPAPMITDETEDELRAQLSKLLEPQNLSDTHVMEVGR